jgi:hypothetical protein
LWLSDIFLAWGQVVFDGIHPILPRFACMADCFLFGLGTPEKARSPAAQLVSAIKTR